MYKAILFDLDNTLLLPVTPLTDKLTALQAEDIALFSTDSAREAQRQAELWTARQILHELETNTRMDDDVFLENVLQCYRSCAAVQGEEANALIYAAVTDRAKSIPVPDVYRLLNVLKEKYVLGIVSNNSARVRTVLDEFELTPYFQVITISAEIGLEKPNPLIMMETCSKIQVNPSECLYVGDHPFDVLCADRAGMDCVWVDRGVFLESDLPAAPKKSICTLTELQFLC